MIFIKRVSVQTLSVSLKQIQLQAPESCYLQYQIYKSCPRKWFYSSSYSCKKRKTDEDNVKSTRKVIQYPPKSTHSPVLIWKNMTVTDVANALEKDVDHVFEAMLFIQHTSQYSSISSVIDDITVIKEIIKKSGRRCQIVAPPLSGKLEVKDKDIVKQPSPDPAVLVKRSPVVTIMGHVDHGKTTLLDALRNTSVVESEFGGITQHIGAFSVKLKSGELITFLDTPGHAAFSAMRARGANVTDIVVLVVAADDGVMEQTVESIRMANEAQVPIIVALNKIDKPTADIERSKKMLVQSGIQVEDAGGDIQVVPISALKKTNLDTLTESIILQAEMMELKGDNHGLVEGIVIESKTDEWRGKLSTALVKRGTLRKGTVLVAGTSFAKVRAMFNHEGKPIQEAPPSTPVEIIGWRSLPSAGDEILEVESEKRANDVVRWREQQKLQQKLIEDKEVIDQKRQDHVLQYRQHLEEKRRKGRFRMRRDGPREKESKDDYVGPRVNVIIKGDVDGSVEAILDVLETYDENNMCRLDVVHYGVGNVTESDVELASTFNAIVYAFNVTIATKIKQLSKSKNVSVRPHNVIYRLFEDIKKQINEQLPLKEVEDVIGEAHVLQQFIVTEGKKKMRVAGARCTKGELKKTALFKVDRGYETVYKGTLSSMRHLKNEVLVIKKDVECGLMLSDFTDDFQMGDTIVCYVLKHEPQYINWKPGF